MTIEFEPLNNPNYRGYVWYTDPLTGERAAAPGRKRRAAKPDVRPADPAVLKRLADETGVAMDFYSVGNMRDMARRLRTTYYWSNEGCYRHGFPMLRHTKSGTCVLCDRLKNEEKKAARAQDRAQRRPTIGDLPRTAQMAKQLGYKFFWTGKPCVKGHVAERRTKGGECVQCACEKRGTKYLPPLPGKQRDPTSIRPELRYVPPPVASPAAAPVPSKAPDNPPLKQLEELASWLEELTGSAPKK